MKRKIQSIQHKLAHYSKANGKNHNSTLIRYFQERFLFRLSKSRYREKFILKGGALIYCIEKQASRPTLDIDFLALQISSNKEMIKKIFVEICTIPAFDGVIFDAENIKISENIKGGNYSVITIKVLTHLGNIRQSLQIDIGFGDIITPHPIETIYPTLINLEPPHLLVYSNESVIAEKFQAMIDLAQYNSRMKDFYDVFRLLTLGKYNQVILEEAIQNTFTRRQTPFLEGHFFFTTDFYHNKRQNNEWKSFVRKQRLDTNLSFPDVVKKIVMHLKPIYDKFA